MSETQAVGVMLALFALRCILPLAVTLGIAYLMNRQVARWEAAAQREAAQAAGVPVVQLQPQKPCWEVRQCTPARRAACPAYQRQGEACWAVRQRNEGALPAGCATCPLYAPALAI